MTGINSPSLHGLHSHSHGGYLWSQITHTEMLNFLESGSKQRVCQFWGPNPWGERRQSAAPQRSSEMRVNGLIGDGKDSSEIFQAGCKNLPISSITNPSLILDEGFSWQRKGNTEFKARMHALQSWGKQNYSHTKQGPRCGQNFESAQPGVVYLQLNCYVWDAFSKG